MQEETISNLVQFLKAYPWRHAVCGLVKGILEELGKYNLDNLEAFFNSSERSGTTTIQIFGGDTSHWTTFCAVTRNNIHDLINLCRPNTYDPCTHEKNVKWQAELENLKKLEQKDSDIRHRVMKQRVNIDNLISELYTKNAITIDRNGGDVEETREHEAALDGMVKELNEITSKRKQVSEICNQLRQLVLHLDPDRLQREINAHAIYKHVCVTLKSLVEKLEEPTLSFNRLSV